MARSFAFVCSLFVVAGVLLMAQRAESTVTCNSVASSVSPCISYIRGMGPLTASCCGGVRSLNNAANTTPTRQLTCNCLKSLATKIPGIKYNLAEGLPALCKVNVPFRISLSTDCSRVR